MYLKFTKFNFNCSLFSLWNASAPTGLWITMNQFQLILLLLLTKSNIPRSIVSYLSGLKATTWSFNFIPFKSIPGFDKMVNRFDFRLPDAELKYFGINSGSTFVTNFSLICIVLILIAIHSLFLLIYRLLKSKVKSKTKWVKCLKKIFQFFAFSLYIRVMFEANVFLLLSSLSELYQWDTSNSSKIISLFFCIYWRMDLLLDNHIFHIPLGRGYGNPIFSINFWIFISPTLYNNELKCFNNLPKYLQYFDIIIQVNK